MNNCKMKLEGETHTEGSGFLPPSIILSLHYIVPAIVWFLGLLFRLFSSSQLRGQRRDARGEEGELEGGAEVHGNNAPRVRPERRDAGPGARVPRPGSRHHPDGVLRVGHDAAEVPPEGGQ